MNIIKAKNLVCPIDGAQLEPHEKQLVCENGHVFDISRQGYVNLLPVQHKRTKHPGDSKVMVSARTQFLNSGIYQAISNKLNELVHSLMAAAEETCILDAGCGEGYYFDALLKYLSNKKGDNKLSFIGLDISKEAIVQANRRNKQISWVVGTNRKPPVADESIDIVLCLFGFLSVQGFNKILKPGGKIVLVDPGPMHLKELREIIYPEVKKQDNSDSSQTDIAGFSLIQSETLQFKTMVSSNEQINHLLVMTPHFYRASKTGKEIASALGELVITVDVTFRVFEKV